MVNEKKAAIAKKAVLPATTQPEFMASPPNLVQVSSPSLFCNAEQCEKPQKVDGCVTPIRRPAPSPIIIDHLEEYDKPRKVDGCITPIRRTPPSPLTSLRERRGIKVDQLEISNPELCSVKSILVSPIQALPQVPVVSAKSRGDCVYCNQPVLETHHRLKYSGSGQKSGYVHRECSKLAPSLSQVRSIALCMHCS